MKPRFPLFLLALMTLGAVGGCSTSSAPGSAGATGKFSLRMTDSPGDYEAVNIVVREVAAHRSDYPDSAGGWEILKSDAPSTYDLLTLRNGVFATLGVAEVPAGYYDQVRLKLGEGSNVVVDGVTHPLKVPSGLQSGYKLIGSFQVPTGGLLDLALDFDAERSVHLTGSGKYMLKPVVRVMPYSTAGGIMGAVDPGTVSTSVYAIQVADTIASTTTGTDGKFALSLLPAGTYSVAFHPAVDYRDTTLAGVSVTAGSTTDVGTVTLTPQ